MVDTQDPTSIAEDAVASGDAVAVPTLVGLVDGLAATLLRGTAVAKASVSLSAEAVRIALGRSEVAPERGDWRFKDPTWSENPLVQARWLSSTWRGARPSTACSTTSSTTTDRHRAERARFVMNVLTSAVAPTNTLLGNPAALKKTLEDGGRQPASAAPRTSSPTCATTAACRPWPSPGALKVGEDLALTPGQVIDKDEFAEVLQYTPATDEVYERPVIVVPPPIGRYYFLDLRPGRSFVEYAVSRGLQTFMLSWRNPSSEQAEWDIDTYAQRILDAVDAVKRGHRCRGRQRDRLLRRRDPEHRRAEQACRDWATTGSTPRRLPSRCSTSGSPPPSARSPRRGCCPSRGGTPGRAGVISARAMGNAFTWMRPNDLVWNYWVNNYLMGEDPPVFDILSWNADGTNLPARAAPAVPRHLRAQPAAHAGRDRVPGVPVDLGTIKVPAYVAGAVNDHLTPWKATYRTTQLLAGDCTFALSNAGHIAAPGQPAGQPEGQLLHRAAGQGPVPPTEWLEGATQQTGSWWEHWADWVVRPLWRSGGRPHLVGLPTFPGPGGSTRALRSPGQLEPDVRGFSSRGRLHACPCLALSQEKQ